MKKLLLLLPLMLMFLLSNISFAEETQQANQELNTEDNKAVIMVQKQPKDEASTQKQDVKRNWFCIVIQVNGKVYYDESND